LALALGKTARQLLSELTSEEITEWQAYYELEPFGELVADQRHGIAQATLANLKRDPRKRPDAFKPEDFLPWHAKHRQKAASADGEFHADPEAQARLIKRSLFKR
jgi:hypothetical protein